MNTAGGDSAEAGVPDSVAKVTEALIQRVGLRYADVDLQVWSYTTMLLYCYTDILLN